MSKRDRKNGVPESMTSIPLVDPHAMPDNPSIGDLVKDATTQMSTLVRAEVELAKAEITRDVKKGLTGSVFFIVAMVVLLYSTFFMFFFLAELLDTWMWRWAAFLTVFILMLVVTAVFAFLGYRKVRRIRGPQQTIESVKETTAALTPGLSKFTGHSAPKAPATPAVAPPAPPARRAVTPPAPAAPARPAQSAEQARSATPPAPARPVEPARTAPVSAPAAATAAVAAAEAADDTAAVIDDAGTEVTVTVYEDTAEIPADEPTVFYTETTVYYDENENTVPTPSTPPASSEDPTAAVYADSGLPVTADDEETQVRDPESDDDGHPLPGDPSGW